MLASAARVFCATRIRRCIGEMHVDLPSCLGYSGSYDRVSGPLPEWREEQRKADGSGGQRSVCALVLCAGRQLFNLIGVKNAVIVGGMPHQAAPLPNSRLCFSRGRFMLRAYPLSNA